MSLTLNSKVFTFSGYIGGRIAQFLNRDSGLAAGFLSATAAVDAPQTKGLPFKVRWKVKLPTIEEASTCACPSGVVNESFVDIVATLPAGASLAERTALAVSIKDLASTPEFQASIVSLITPSA